MKFLKMPQIITFEARQVAGMEEGCACCPPPPSHGREEAAPSQSLKPEVFCLVGILVEGKTREAFSLQ